MNEQERLTELQRQIATAQGYTELRPGFGTGEMHGVLYADEGHTIVPRWPWDIDATWRLVKEIEQEGFSWELRKLSRGYLFQTFQRNEDGYILPATTHQGGGDTEPEAVAACWLMRKAHTTLYPYSRPLHQP